MWGRAGSGERGASTLQKGNIVRVREITRHKIPKFFVGVHFHNNLAERISPRIALWRNAETSKFQNKVMFNSPFPVGPWGTTHTHIHKPTPF